MRHDQAKELLLDLAYGELAPDAAEELRRHAAGCAECESELARIAAVRRVAARLDDRAPSPASREELVLSARRASSSRRFRTWLRRPATLSFAAAAAVVAMVVGVTLKLAPNELGGAGDGARGGVAEKAAPGGPPEPLRSEERREAQPEPAAPPPVFARPSAPPPPVRKAPGPAIPSADVASRGAAAPAPEPAARSSRTLDPQPHALAEAAAPQATGAARASQKATASAPDHRGGLVEERRQLRCGNVLVERTALVAPGGRIVRLTERRGGAVAERWYDDSGRRSDAGTPEQGASGAPGVELPLVAPTLEAVGTRCGW